MDHGLFKVTIAYGILTIISVVTQSLPTLVSHVLHSPCVEPQPLSSTGLPNLTLLSDLARRACFSEGFDI